MSRPTLVVNLLGGFEVTAAGRAIPAGAWRNRRVAEQIHRSSRG